MRAHTRICNPARRGLLKREIEVTVKGKHRGSLSCTRIGIPKEFRCGYPHTSCSQGNFHSEHGGEYIAPPIIHAPHTYAEQMVAGCRGAYSTCHNLFECFVEVTVKHNQRRSRTRTGVSIPEILGCSDVYFTSCQCIFNHNRTTKDGTPVAVEAAQAYIQRMQSL